MNVPGADASSSLAFAALGVLGCVAVAACSSSGGGAQDDGLSWKRGHRRAGAGRPPSSPRKASKAAAADAASSPAAADAAGVAAAVPATAPLARWEELKLEGTAHFKGDEFAKALELYAAAAEALRALPGGNGEQLATLHSNCAIARSKLRDQLEEEAPGAASRLPPLVVLDCNRALSEKPTPAVRCKALKNRALSLEVIHEEPSLLHAVCDFATAKKEAVEQANAKGVSKRKTEMWANDAEGYEKQKTAVFTKLLALRLTAWKGRLDQREMMFGLGCQLCGTATDAPQGTVEQNKPLKTEVYEFPRPVLLSVREQLDAFRPARTAAELQDGTWPIEWTASTKSKDSAALQVFRRFQEASILTSTGEYSSALPIWELCVRTGASEYEGMVAGGMESAPLAAQAAICTADAAFYCGVLYYSQGAKAHRMKKRRTKDAMVSHGFGQYCKLLKK